MTRLTAGTALASALAATALVLLVAGCAGGGTSPTTPPPTPSPSASPTTTPSPTPTGSVDPNAPAGQCADAALKVEVQYVDAGAGSIDSNVVFTNTGSSSCELRGAPGVSVVNAAGVQLGEAAEQIGDDTPATLTIEPGSSVVAQLTAVNIDPDGGPLDNCPVVQGTGYLVYPPHSFTAFVVSTGKPVPACESTAQFLTVGPVTAG